VGLAAALGLGPPGLPLGLPRPPEALAGGRASDPPPGDAALARRLNGEITRQLDLLAEAYGSRGECHRLAGQLHSQLRFGKIDHIFKSGLHEFLTKFIDDNLALGKEITKFYLV
jgi:hypothetical protein